MRRSIDLFKEIDKPTYRSTSYRPVKDSTPSQPPKTTSAEWEPVAEKPPLGLQPRYIHNQARINDIVAAMSRYTDAGKQIPREWIEELRELNIWQELHGIKEEVKDEAF